MLRKPYSKFITINQYNEIRLSQGKNTIAVDVQFETECKRIFEKASPNRKVYNYIKLSFPTVPPHLIKSAENPDLIIHGSERYELKYSTKNLTALANFVVYNKDGILETLNKGEQSCYNVVQNTHGIKNVLNRAFAKKYGGDFPVHFVNQ